MLILPAMQLILVTYPNVFTMVVLDQELEEFIMQVNPAYKTY